MITPAIVPSKAKTWIAAIGGFLTVAVPLVLDLATYLPPQWSAAVGGVVAILTALGVYQAPYVKPGVVLAPDTQAVAVASELVPPAEPPPPSVYRNPWV